MDDREILEAIEDEHKRHFGITLDDAMREAIRSGSDPSMAIANIAESLSPVEIEVMDEAPDIGHYERLDAIDIEHYLKEWFEAYEDDLRSTASAEDGNDYMFTDEPSRDEAPSATHPSGNESNYDTNRFQTEASVGEGRDLAEGVDPNGNKIVLTEIAERQPIRGKSVRWEIKSLPDGAILSSGGPLYLDDPNFSDAALAQSRAMALAAFAAITDGNMRDLRANLRTSMDEKSKRLAALRKNLEGLKLSEAQVDLVNEIEANIMDYRPDFLGKVGEILKQPWDAGSSWEIVEANGKTKLVRRESQEAFSTPKKHAYREGQELRIWSSVMPDDVIVRECVGDSRYKVQSSLTGRVYYASENDLYSTASDGDDRLFDGGFPLDEGGLASLF